MMSLRIFTTLACAAVFLNGGAAQSNAQSLARLRLKAIDASIVKGPIPVKMSMIITGADYGPPELRAGAGENLVAVKMKGSIPEPINVSFFVDCFLAEFQSQPGMPPEKRQSDAQRFYRPGKMPPDWIAHPTNLPGGTIRKMIRLTLEKEVVIFVEAVFRIPDNVTDITLRFVDEPEAPAIGKVAIPRKTQR